MNHELVLSSIRQGDVTADHGWKMLSEVVPSLDPEKASDLVDALRSWTWKAVDRRRRDDELGEWVSIMNRVEAFLPEGSVELAARVQLLVELLHESIAVAELPRESAPLGRKHLAGIISTLSSRGGWTSKNDLMSDHAIRPANTTRLMSHLADLGLVSQRSEGREVFYRLTGEGYDLARSSLPDDEGTSVAMESDEQDGSAARQPLSRLYRGGKPERRSRLTVTYRLSAEGGPLLISSPDADTDADFDEDEPFSSSLTTDRQAA